MVKRPLPKKAGRLCRRTTAFCGLDRRAGAPFGALKEGEGFTSADGVTLQGAPAWKWVYSYPSTLNPMCLTAIGGGLFSLCRTMEWEGDEYRPTEDVQVALHTEDGKNCVSGVIRVEDGGQVDGFDTTDFDGHRSMVQFNVYSADGAFSDAVGGTYDKKLLIFPDKLVLSLPVEKDNFTVSTMSQIRDTVPDLHFVTVSGGRLFGVDEGRIYAGAYNDPWNWDVDTPYDIGAENAWVTTTGADTRGDGAFTAIAAYDGGVWCMKEDFGHVVSGNGNPFSVKDTDLIGAVDARAVARGDGRLFFVRKDGVRMAQGSSVSVISDPLCLPAFAEGICAYRDGTLYVAEGDSLYLYHLKSESWSILPLPEGKLLSLTSGEKGLYALVRKADSENSLYLLAGEVKEWSFTLHGTDLSADTDKGPATLTLQADADRDAVISVELTEESEGKTLSLGQMTAEGGRMRYRKLIRGGAGQSFAITVRVKGQAVIRSLSISARSGVKDDG